MRWNIMKIIKKKILEKVKEYANKNKRKKLYNYNM